MVELLVERDMLWRRGQHMVMQLPPFPALSESLTDSEQQQMAKAYLRRLGQDVTKLRLVLRELTVTNEAIGRQIRDATVTDKRTREENLT